MREICGYHILQLGIAIKSVLRAKYVIHSVKFVLCILYIRAVAVAAAAAGTT